MNFLGIGTGELIVIIIIGVLVVGPDKMVELASKLGRLFVKLRQMTDGATHEFREALAVDEIKEAIQGVTDEVKDIGQEVKGTADDVATIGTEAQGAVQDIQKVAEGKPVVVAPKAVPAGVIPQAVLDIMGPATQTGVVGSTMAPDVLPATDDHGDTDIEPVKLPATTIAGDDEDEEAVELDDVVVVETSGDNHRNMTESAS